MIEVRQGDLFDDPAEALVNTVNCEGVMGRGIALQFKRRFPKNYEAYAKACKRGEVVPGRVFVFETGALMGPQFILNFPTKRHWRMASRMEDIEAGLRDLVRIVRELGIVSVAIPPLGCGLGGLSWPEVRAQIEAAFQTLPEVRVSLYAPGQAPAAESIPPPPEVPKMTVGRADLVYLIGAYLDGGMDPECTLLELHKLLYFLQEAGEPLKLDYEKGRYGPYAKNLHHVLNRIEGHFIDGFADGGDAPGKVLTLRRGIRAQVKAFLEGYPETLERLHRVTNLVEGFESPSWMELLATVHWVITRENARTSEAVVQAVRGWNTHKRLLFTPWKIGIALQMLQKRGWMPVTFHEETLPTANSVHTDDSYALRLAEPSAVSGD